MYINKTNIQKINKLRCPRFTNCFGSVIYSLGLTENPEWLDLAQIEHFISTYTKKVSKPKDGDIVVFFDQDNDISHVAIKLKNKTYWHKPGSMRAESVSLNFIIKFYNSFPNLKVCNIAHYRFNYSLFDKIQEQSMSDRSQIYIEFLKISGLYKNE